MTEQNKPSFSTSNSVKFRALFGRAGEFGSFNDLKLPNQTDLQTEQSDKDQQLNQEVGPGGITITARPNRVVIGEFGPIRAQTGCSEIDGFFDYNQKLDDPLV